MANKEEREKARELFIKENREVSEISQLLGVAETTIYRWKREDEDWDEKRKLWSLSPAEIEKIYLECVKEFVFRIKNDPKLMMDSKITDSITKHIANLKN